jgi:nitrate reductase alpha subunit
MKDIILKPGTFLKDTKTTNTKNIPGQSMEDFVVGLLKNPTCCAKYVTLTKGVVTQTGNINSAVTLNQPAGEITTVSATIAGTVNTFTLNNSYIKADSVILATVNDTNGAGLVVVQVDNIVAGSCSISLAGVVSNTGTVTIGFGIF